MRNGQLAAPTPEWFTEAACRDANPDVFFPDRSDNQAARAAKRICVACPVNAECLEFAVSRNIFYGIWGGCSVKERRPARREWIEKNPTDRWGNWRHGIRATYVAGCRCSSCTMAERKYQRERVRG